MTVTDSAEQGSPPEAMAGRLIAQADRVRASDILGRSDPLRKLFDYLVGRSDRDEAPKEFEIAQALGKGISFDVAGDATIRVYIHRLRKKLDDFYAADPVGSERLDIPRGSYRLVLRLASCDPADAAQPPAALIDAQPAEPWAPILPAPALPKVTRYGVGTAVIGAVLFCAALAGGYLWSSLSTYPRALAATTLWQPFAEPSSHTVIVMGTQALPSGHPHLVSMGSTLSLARILPELSAMDPRHAARPTIVNVSYMPSDMLKDSNIVYIGTMAQLGLLTDIVFAHSGFTPPDEESGLIDRASRRIFTSAPTYADHHQFTSYGYLASLSGPSGNRILVISGATDGAIVQMAEIASDPAQVKALTERGGTSFEALYAVETLDSVNVAHRLELLRATSGPRPHI